MGMENKKKPNVLSLYSDQHSARTLGCYGNKQVKTPNLDRLAREGVLMQHAYTQNPICTPSRMCMLSGQYAHNTGYYGLAGEKPEQLPNLFGLLKEQGYMTGAAGKLHTPAGWVSDQCDYVADGYGYEVPLKPWNRHLEEGCQGLVTNDYTDYLARLGCYGDRDDKILQEWFEENQHKKGQCVDARYSRIPKEHTIEMWSANCANKFIEQADQEQKPFCFWLTMPRPHQTYAAAKEFWDLYEGIELELPPNYDDKMEHRSSAAKDTQRKFQMDKDWIAFGDKDFDAARKRVLRGYYACVSQMDDAVGTVLNKLEELGIRENTLIIYMTDHGEFAGEHGMIEKAPGIGFRCVTQIPMIFSWKGRLPENEVRDEIIESVDILPTICSLSGIMMPDWVDGKDALELIESGRAIHDFAVTENPNTKTIHTKKYKLTQYLPEFEGQEFGELYDIEADPYELKNLYFEPEYEKVVQDLRYQLYCWLIRTSRVKTAHPTIPDTGNEKDVSGGISWDLADYVGRYGKDGKVGEAFYQELIKKNMKNYL